MVTHSSVLAWRIPGMAWGGGVTDSQTGLKGLSRSSSSLPEIETLNSVLPGTYQKPGYEKQHL